MPPIPLALMPSIIAGGAALAGTGATAFSVGRTNRQSRKFAIGMYERQQRDQLHNWNLQNSYNSPQAQMQRFADAGLNPHLIYGQGNSGPAGQLDTPNPTTPQFKAADFSGIGGAANSALAAFFDMDIKSAQADNLRAQNDVLIQEKLLKEAQTLQTQASTKRSIFDLDFDTEFRDISGDAKKEALRQTRVNTDATISRVAMESLSNAQGIKEAAQRMLESSQRITNMKVQNAKTAVDIAYAKTEMRKIEENIKLLQQQGVLNGFDIEMKRLGMSWSDPYYIRMAGKLLTKASDIKLGPGPEQDTLQPSPLKPYGNKY